MQDGALLEVQDTNLEAMKAKWFPFKNPSLNFFSSAINLGYLVDLYAECFVTEHAMKDITINRGYWYPKPQNPILKPLKVKNTRNPADLQKFPDQTGRPRYPPQTNSQFRLRLRYPILQSQY